MKKIKLILPVLASTFVVGGMLGLSSVSYADNAEDQNGGNSAMNQGNMKGGSMFTQGLEEYLDVDSLSGDDLTLYNAALKNFQESMQPSKGSTSTGDQSTMQQTMSTAWTTFMQSIRGLVSEDNLDAFDEFVAAGLQMPTAGNFGSGDHAQMGSGDKPSFGSGDHAQMGSGDKPNFGSGNHAQMGSGDKPSFGTGNGEHLDDKGGKQTSSNTSDFKYVTGDIYTQIDEILGKLSQTKLIKVNAKIDAAIAKLDSTDSLYDMKLEIYSELKIMVEALIVEDTTTMIGVPTGEMPAGGPGASGGGQDSSSIVKTVGTGGYYQDGGTATKTDVTYTITGTDKSVIIVTNGGSLTLSDAVISKTGNTSSNEASEFYGLNAAILAESGSTITISDTKITTNGNGPNGVFAMGEDSLIKLNNVIINTIGTGGSRGLDATYDGTIEAENITISTVGAHSATIATDRGEGNVTVISGTLTTQGEGSPIIYSTGKIKVSNSTGTANGSEAAVIEGQNSIEIIDSVLKGLKSWGVMIYQSFSGDADGTGGIFKMTGGSLTAEEGPLFYITNTIGYITLNDVETEAKSGIILRAEANARWGTTGSNGGTVYVTGDSQNLDGDIEADSISQVSLSLQNESNLTGAINADNTAKSMNLTLDDSSTWTVTADSYLTSLSDTDGISGSSITNIIGNGNNVYYDATVDANSELGGETYTLVNGGNLMPIE